MEQQSYQIPTPQAEPTPQIPPHQNNVVAIIISVVITALAVGAGVYFWQYTAVANLQNQLDQKGAALSSCQNDKNNLSGELATCQTDLQTQKAANEKLQADLDNIKNVGQAIIENGNVYYINDQGEKITIATSVNDPENVVNNFTYKFAQISPNGKYVLYGGTGWEWINEYIYDIASKETHKLAASSSDYGQWLNDNRVRIVGECGMGISCGTYESTSTETPWELEIVEQPK